MKRVIALALSRLGQLELWGIAFVVTVGTLLHFVYGWTGGSALVVPFAPVNESVWEHQKLVFWPLLLWGLLVEWPALGLPPGPILTAKAAAAAFAMALVILLHYGYRSLTTDHVVWIDVGIFIVAAALGQWVSYRILGRGSIALPTVILSVIGVTALIVAFTVFSYQPPQLRPFLDEPSGSYGPRPSSGVRGS